MPRKPDYAEMEARARAEAERERRRRMTLERRLAGQTDWRGYTEWRFGAKVWRKPGDEEGHKGVLYTEGQEQILDSLLKYRVTGVMSANSTGKTFIASHGAAWFQDCFGVSETGAPQECEIYVVAAPPSANLERIWSEIQRVCSTYPDIFPVEPTSEQLLLGPKRFIQTIPIPVNKTPQKRKESFAGKHARNILFVFDEANSIDEAIWQVVLNEGMASGVMVRLLFFFNPRERFGPAYERFRDGRCNPVSMSAFDHPNVISGKLVIPSGPTRERVAARTYLETRAWEEGEPWNDMCFELPECLVGASGVDDKGNITPPLPAGKRVVIVDHELAGDYNYSVRGVAPLVTAGALISEMAITEARARWDAYWAQHGKVPDIRPVGGFDVATTTDKNALAWRYDEFLDNPETWMPLGGIDVVDSCQHVAERYKERNGKVVFVDSNGLGEGCPKTLRLMGANCRGHKGNESAPAGTTEALITGPDGVPRKQEVRAEFHDLRSWLLWRFAQWIKNGGMLPPNERLLNALRKLTYDKDTRQKIEVVRPEIHKKRLGYSPDEMVACMLTFAPDTGGWAFAIVPAPRP